METILSLENARAFNASLKKAIFAETGQKVKIEIINSYKFPNCWVRVYAETGFTNDFRLKIFDAGGHSRESLGNVNDIQYGNIGEKFISAIVSHWTKLFEAK